MAVPKHDAVADDKEAGVEDLISRILQRLLRLGPDIDRDAVLHLLGVRGLEEPLAHLGLIVGGHRDELERLLVDSRAELLDEGFNQRRGLGAVAAGRGEKLEDIDLSRGESAAFAALHEGAQRREGDRCAGVDRG